MIDLALAKAHVRAEGCAEDALIELYIEAAQALVEGQTGNLLTRREVTQELDRFGGHVPLWWGPNPSGIVIDYVDGGAIARTVSGPRVVRDRVYPPVGGWPMSLEASPVVVTYQAGYAEGAAPADFDQAQLMLVAHWYLNREAVTSGNAASEVPLAVEAIIRRHRPVLI